MLYMKTVSVVILNYNGLKLLPECLDSVMKQTYKDFEVILVNNGSSDDSHNFVKKNYPSVNLIEIKNNCGFAGGMNHGFRAAKGKFVVMLNNDTKLDKNFIKEIIVPTKDPSVGMVSPKVIYYYEKTIDTVGLQVTKSGLAKDTKSEKDKDKAIVASGAAVLYRKSMLDDIKMNNQYFDEDFFAYCEDLDLGLRAVLRGWKFAYAPKSEVLHIHSATISKEPTYFRLLGHRNNLWAVIKDFPTSVLLKNILSIAFVQTISIPYYFLKGKPLLILKLKYQMICGIPKMLKKRKIIQARNKISSKDFEKLLINKLL